MSETEIGRHRDPDRFLTSVDAIALTLLVMLAVPASGDWPLFLRVLRGPAERALCTARGSGATRGPVGR